MDDPDLKTAFDAFTALAHRRSWHTAQGRSHWLEAEGWQDAIAGPLWSIVKDGGCEYVYSREDSFFAGVDDPTALRNRLFEWHARLTAKLKSFTPASPAEHRDRRLMNSRLADIVALIDRALEIESQRWQASRNPAE